LTTFVLVPGSFVGGWYWSQVADRLRKARHCVEVIEQLPSEGIDPAALGDLAADGTSRATCPTVGRSEISGPAGSRGRPQGHPDSVTATETLVYTTVQASDPVTVLLT